MAADRRPPPLSATSRSPSRSARDAAPRRGARTSSTASGPEERSAVPGGEPRAAPSPAPTEQPPTEQPRDEKRERIVQAARERFRHYGFRKTTMREIAADVGVAVGTLYLYYRDKDQLMAACAGQFAETHRAQGEQIVRSGGTAADRLRQYLRARFLAAQETRTGSRFAAELAREVLRVQPDRLADESRLMWTFVTELLRDGVARKEWRIADPAGDARILLYAVAWFFPHALMEMPRWPTIEELDQVIDWFVATWSRGGR